MIELEKRDDVVPECAHCSRGLLNVWFQEIRGVLGKRYIYFCPHCKKVLGISHRKGFWAG